MITLENRDNLLEVLAAKAQENRHLAAEAEQQEYYVGRAAAFQEAERLVGLYLAE